MNNKPPIKRFDGEYEIIFSETFNVYEDFLRIHNIGFLHEIFDIRIEFQKQDPQENQPSIQASWVRQD